MDSFGLDFSSGDLLDLGSLGMWGGNSTPVGSSPNGNSLPFSIGTPTGVQSLGDDAFANLPVANDDFSFDSPKAANSNTTPKTDTSASTGNSNDGLSNAFFGAELESDKKASTVDAKIEAHTKSEKKEVKQSASKTNSSVPPNATTVSSSSDTPENTSFQAFLMGDASPPNTSASAKTNTATSQTTKVEPGSAVSSAPGSNVSSARPHIDSSTSTTAVSTNSAANALSQQAHQQRFQAQMGMNPGQTGFQGFPIQPVAQIMSQGHAPNATQGRSFSYEEEFMRLKAIMQSHPDLIPPPSDVLRIGMAQSAASGNFVQQRAGPQMINRPGANPVFNQFSAQAPNPNMMMHQPGQSPMVDAARIQAMQAQMRQQQMRQGTQMAQGRTTPGSGDNQAAWQSENDLPLRRKMIGKIVSLLQQRKPDAPTEWIRRLPDMARRLEDSLYRTAKNRDEYGDFTSLKTRLQHLAVTMGARAQHKGGNPRAPSMMPNAAPGMVPGPQGMTMNPIAPGGVMNPQAQMISNMQYANMAGRMTPQQLQMQQLQMQMQNPQMRQQLTPQQIQQLQQAQMQQRRQAYQQMQQQHAQLQRQSSMQQQQFQQNQAQAQAQAQLQRQHSMRQQQQQQMQQRAQQQQRQQQQQLQRRTSMSGGSANRMSGDMSVGAQGGLGDPNDFLNLDLSGSLLGDDLGLDMLGASDPFKAPDQVTGHKRGMSQNQQQLKRAKVSGGGTPQSSQNNGSQMSAVNAK